MFRRFDNAELLDGAEAVLTLRAVTSNGDFEEYWRFHPPVSTSDFTPAPRRAGQYALGA